MNAHERQKKIDAERMQSARYNESMLTDTGYAITLAKDGRGNPLPTIENMLRVMRIDSQYRQIKYNLLRDRPERHVIDLNGRLTIDPWTDADDAESLRFMEDNYGIYAPEKHNAALRLLFKEREFDPIRDIIDDLRWDGVERCESFLTKWAGADDSAYTREVSRMIFAEGIARLYVPGSKCDDVPILIGKQGGGKSSLIRFLAINDEYFGEIKEIEGDKAVEQLDGVWIAEIPEMAAMTKAKEVEAVKAFVTRQRDKYRRPYDKRTVDKPRRCTFIASTNNYQPLTDLTGARRFFPVETKSDGYELFKHEQEVRDYICQCWAEARDKWRAGKMPNYARPELLNEYRERQAAATQDDWRIGAIESYISGKPIGSFVCVRELMRCALSADKDHPKDPTPRDSKEIALIMIKMTDWEKAAPQRTEWGTQRGWRRVSAPKDFEVGDELPF